MTAVYNIFNIYILLSKFAFFIVLCMTGQKKKGDKIVSDEEIIGAIVDRQSDVMDCVITKYARLLWQIANDVLRGMGSEEDAEECVADVFIALWNDPEHFNPTRGSLKTWLCIMVRSRSIDRYRVLSRSNTMPIDMLIDACGEGVQEQVLRKERYEELTRAIDLLEAEERDIFLRRYIAGQKPRTIARVLGLDVKQINNCLYRTKQRLRNIMISSKGDLS